MSSIRKNREKALQDARFKINDGSRGVERFYAITDTSHSYFKNRITELARGKHALEFGCGNGANALELCRTAKAVSGIDISDVAVDIGTRHAAEAGITNVEFRAMDAENLQFADETFDVICGVGILHHLDLQRAYSEIARTLKPDGYAMFIEPLGYNPFINAYRRLTPKIRTPDEHPLLDRDLKTARKFFGNVKLHYYYLTTLLVAPFATSPIGKAAAKVANSVDRALFSALPPLRKYAWFVIMEMSEPVKQSTSASAA
jgi:SAM-dependent methyltransferase